MLSAIFIGPAASGRGLCYIDRVLSGDSKSRINKLEVLARRKYTDYKFVRLFIGFEKAKLSV